MEQLFDTLLTVKSRLVDADSEIKESFNNIVKYFDGKTFSIIGDSISTFKGSTDKGCKSLYPYGDVQDLKSHYLGYLNGILINNSSYSGGGLVKYSGLENALNRVDSVISRNPSIIIVLIGINDCREDTTVEQFRSAYTKLAEKLKSSNSKVYFCTLLNCNKETVQNQNLPEFNKIIRSFGNTINLNKLWSIDEVSKYTIDGLHPNKAGMKLIAEEINKKL